MNVINIKNILLRLPRIQKRILVAAGDACACAFSFWLSFGIGLDSWGLIAGDKIQILLLSLCIAAPIFYAFGLYLAIFRYVGALALRSILLAFIIYAIIFLAALLIAFRDTPIGVGILHLLIFFSGIGLSRWFIRHWLGGVNSKIIRSHYSKPRILIYGAGSAGRQLKAALAINRAMILKGFVDDNKSLHGNLIDGIPILGPHELQGAIDRYKITDVIFAIPSAKQKNRNEIIESLSKLGVKVQTLPGLFERHSGRIRLSDVKKFDMNDLLGREAVPPNYSLLKQNVGNKVVLVTGAGGSIGSELCRQIIKYLPTSIILVDNSEYALYIVEKELLRLISEQVPPEVGSSDKLQIDVFPCLVSVQDFDGLERIMATHKPNIVFHAAAYKHVTLVEKNPADGIKNNIFGTLNCAKISIAYGVKNFILVSTDKAVRPTSIMGASKRISEMVLQALSDEHKIESSTIFSMVRFGNVLGSSGSVVPIFREQINQGGPITLTDLEVTRYFMTIPEAAQLVIQAYAMSLGGEVFVLDMGHPVKIYELAKKMINLSGHRVKSDLCPDGDIEIKVIGLRPGEKLFEELLIGENALSTDHPKIMKAQEEFLNWRVLESRLDEIRVALISSDMKSIEGIFKEIVHGYNRIV
jgi:FlaA1/EpsC-like NDP-sugar epimerase